MKRLLMAKQSLTAENLLLLPSGSKVYHLEYDGAESLYAVLPTNRILYFDEEFKWSYSVLDAEDWKDLLPCAELVATT